MRNLIVDIFRPALLFFYGAVAIGAVTVDTTVVGDGTPGPYSLGRLFVNPSTIRVTRTDSIETMVPPYTYVDKVNGVLFSEPIDSGEVLAVHFETSFYGLSKIYRLYEPYEIDTTDTASAARVAHAERFRAMIAHESLDISGYKSVGVSVGNQGQMNLEQALEVRIFGEIAPQTELSANLNDQGTSLEGDTREIGELDMVYISLTNPRYNATVGDQFVSLPSSGLLYERKKIKGLSAAFTPRNYAVRGFGAISGGSYAVETFRGRQGFQGPYYLEGNGEPDIITPIAGTVRVLVDGREVTEGIDADYTLDYDLGTLLFGPGFPIRDEQVIKVEYEYKTFDYQRMFFGGDVAASSPDSAITARGTLWYETDNKNQPIELNLSPAIRDSLKQAGDEPPPFSTAREVHPNDVASQSKIYPLYRRRFSTTAMESVYVYTRYEPANPYDSKGYYYVWFRDVGMGSGDYAVDSIDYRGPRYRYVGKGQGAYSPSAPVPAPERSITGEIVTAFNPRPWLNLTVDIAGEERDRNLYSDLDDNDNTASAARSSVRVGRKGYEEPGAWVRADHTFTSKRFSREVISFYERKIRWGRENDRAAGGRQHAWETFVGATPLPGLSTEFSYGQYLRGDTLLTHRSANASRLALGERFLLEYAGDFFIHTDTVELQRQHHDRLTLTLDFKPVRFGLLFDDERKSNGTDTVKGYLGGGADFTLKPLNLFEGVYYSQQRLGDTWLVSASDTGSYFSWTQRIRHSPLKGWNISARSSFQRRVRGIDTLSTTLITASNDISAPTRGFATRQEYAVTSERGSEFVQLPVFAGEGQGAYSIDSATDELTPDPFGSYYVYEQEVFDRSSMRRVRKTSLRADWSFRPQVSAPKGFLADIGWSGSLGMREHLKSDLRLRHGSWLPGYYSLRLGDRETVDYANVSYRQSADWRPREDRDRARIGAHIRPSYRLVRRLEERELTWGSALERSWEKWFLALTGEALIMRRDGVAGMSGGRDTIQDQYVEFLERYEMLPGLFLFVKETAGRAAKDRSERQWGRYFLGQPGIRFQPRERGFAEATYTVTYVDIDGTLDYRMARGYSAGLSHTISVFSDIRIGSNFSISGNYRGEFNRAPNSDAFGKGIHVVTMEVKAYL